MLTMATANLSVYLSIYLPIFYFLLIKLKPLCGKKKKNEIMKVLRRNVVIWNVSGQLQTF